jgi:2-succinyl-6-hydroxy-2,4-cyclohexadiene-1-carboxylate synthase
MLYRMLRGKGEPVVVVHGFTQTHRSWGPFLDVLAATRQVVAVDAPGHGRSASVDAGLWEAARLVGEAGGEATYLGYSMGGRLALHLALAQPGLVRRLVLISASAGIDDPAERAARRRADEQLAGRVQQEGVEAFVRWWLTRPMWDTLPAAAADPRARLDNTAAGLASSLRRAGQGQVDPPLWDRLGELSMPVLVVAGALDRAYAERAGRLGEAIAGAAVAIIPGAGHACHLERPAEVGAVVVGWLDSHPAGQSASPTTNRAPNSS